MSQEVIINSSPRVLSQYNYKIADAGPPLGPKDFLLASTLPRIPSNNTNLDKLWKVALVLKLIIISCLFALAYGGGGVESKC